MGDSRPYFCGIDQTLNFQQKEALAQGILQVVETIPDGFDVFEFQFAEHRVHLYKLDRGMVLLVLTRSSLVYADYGGVIKQLKAVLQEDSPNAIATFRLIAGNIALTGLNYRKHAPDPAAMAETTATANSPGTRFTPPAPEAATPTAPHDSWSSERPDSAVALPPEPTTLKEAIVALNHLSQFTTQYLGTHVIVNYWKATRPTAEAVAQLQIRIDRFGGILPEDRDPFRFQERRTLSLVVGDGRQFGERLEGEQKARTVIIFESHLAAARRIDPPAARVVERDPLGGILVHQHRPLVVGFGPQVFDRFIGQGLARGVRLARQGIESRHRADGPAVLVEHLVRPTQRQISDDFQSGVEVQQAFELLPGRPVFVDPRDRPAE